MPENVLDGMMNPVSAEVAGPRTVSLSEQEPVQSVLDAMFQAGRAKVVELFRATSTGQSLEREATRQKLTDLVTHPVAIIAALILLFIGIAAVARKVA